MRAAFVTLLLVVATAMQPLLAIPASCMMGGERQKVTCASCCSVKTCCAVSEQQKSTPVAAVQNHAGDLVVATIPLLSPAVPVPLERLIQYRSLAGFDGHAHAPSPLALNCIQLI